MTLDDYSLNKAERAFFEQASMTIYKWFADEEKLKITSELRSGGLLGINDLKVKDRLFRLLHFIEVRYVRIGKWVNDIFRHLKEINAIPQSETKIEDVEINDLQDKILRLSTVAEKFSEGNIEKYFVATLRELELEKEYKQYITRLEGSTNE